MTHDEEGHVKAHLVVARSGGAVGNGAGTDFLGVAGNCHALEDAFRTDGDGIDVVAEHVSEDHILQTLLVVLLRYVEGDIFCGAEFVGVLLVGFQLFCAEASGVGAGGIYFIALFAGEIHHGVGGVESATEGDDYFFLFHNREEGF